jgi:hypothetical protein
VNGEYLEKKVSFKWEPDLNLLVIEKIKGKGRGSFKHISRPRFESGITHFGHVLIGKMIRVTNDTTALQIYPIIMKQTVQLELDNWIPLDDTYNKEEVVAGYEDNQPKNFHMQLLIES